MFSSNPFCSLQTLIMLTPLHSLFFSVFVFYVILLISKLFGQQKEMWDANNHKQLKNWETELWHIHLVCFSFLSTCEENQNSAADRPDSDSSTNRGHFFWNPLRPWSTCVWMGDKSLQPGSRLCSKAGARWSGGRYSSTLTVCRVFLPWPAARCSAARWSAARISARTPASPEQLRRHKRMETIIRADTRTGCTASCQNEW